MSDPHVADPSAPVYYAHKLVGRHDGEVRYYHASPDRWWVELHGVNEPIVPVRLRERTQDDPPSPYWGWVGAECPQQYEMVWPAEVLLDMCFPYGPKAEEERGRGRKVNLVVTEVDSAALTGARGDHG